MSESREQLLTFTVPESDRQTFFAAIEKHVQKAKELGSAYPLLVPATIRRESDDASLVHVRSKEDQFALAKGAEKDVVLDFTPVHACLGVALRNAEGKRMTIHVRKRQFTSESEMRGLRSNS